MPWPCAPGTSEHRLLAAQRLQKLAIDLCRSHGIAIDVQGVVPDKPVVMVANHVSYVDTLVLPSLVPATCVAKKEVAAWPGVGGLAASFGTLFVERGNPHSGAVALRQALRALSAGVSVIAFPEGTTSPGDRLLPFHRGIFGLAILQNVPVLPITLTYSDSSVAWVGEDPFLNHYLRVASRRETRVTVRVAPLLSPRLFGGARALAKAAQLVIAEGLRRSR
ncbi:MAG: lysophospholipid acyltransferase family protein [Deltaproteobacteria bacterium]|nr:lysophospholipid acyltransferase family protein [Deltaproteobacteria bacterium]